MTARERKSLLNWNRCDVCGHFIAMADFESGAALREMTTPDSAYSMESYKTLCRCAHGRAVAYTRPMLATAMGLIPIREGGTL